MRTYRILYMCLLLFFFCFFISFTNWPEMPISKYARRRDVECNLQSLKTFKMCNWVVSERCTSITQLGNLTFHTLHFWFATSLCSCYYKRRNNLFLWWSVFVCMRFLSWVCCKRARANESNPIDTERCADIVFLYVVRQADAFSKSIHGIWNPYENYIYILPATSAHCLSVFFLIDSIFSHPFEIIMCIIFFRSFVDFFLLFFRFLLCSKCAAWATNRSCVIWMQLKSSPA